MAEVVITVYGTPWPEGSLRAFKDRAGNVRVIHDNPKALQDWRDAVTKTARATGSSFLRRPVTVTMTLFLPRPRGHYRTGKDTGHLLTASAPLFPGGTRFDTDKLARAVLDSLTGVLYADDAQVTDLIASKRYAGHGDPTGAVIHVDETR